MAIELLTPFTKVKLEPEVKAKKRKQVIRPIWLWRIKFVNNYV